LKTLIAFIFALILASHGTAQDVDISQFATPDRYSDAAISPDGQHIALTEFSDGAFVKVYKMDDDGSLTAIAVGKAKDGSGRNYAPDGYIGLKWVTPDRLLVHTSNKFLNKRDSTVNNRGEYHVLQLSTKELTNFLAPQFHARVHAPQDRIIHWPTTENPYLVMSLYVGRTKSDDPREKTFRNAFIQKPWPSLFKIDPKDGSAELHQVGDTYIFDWLADRSGIERIRYKARRSGEVITEYRLASMKRWTRLEAADKAPEKVFSIVSFTPNPDHILVISNHASDTAALYTFDLREQVFVDLVASHPKYDVSSVRQSLDGEIEVVSAGQAYAYLSDREEEILTALSKQSTLERVALVDRDMTDKRRIYRLDSSDDTGGYYLFTTDTLKLTKLVDVRPEGATQPSLSKTWPMNFAARDGLKLDTYLSLPSGSTPQNAKALPFVILPHGGPWARDFAEYDPLTQHINSLGIGVLKVNFRGSDGYGTSFEELGVGEWGKAMQADLNDALNWAVGQGWVDANRVCMVGWSYGGYAAMMASIEDTQKYKCAASIAGVTDLVRLVRTTRDKEALRRIGVKSQYDSRSVSDISPLQRANEIDMPIFLAHGSGDKVVDVRDHYASFLRQLKKHNVDVDYVAFLNGDHSLSSPADRAILYDRLGAFLTKHLLNTSAAP
jgi:dipeptidyl aminopeptidase/acylaminoacyl peptidase